MIPGPTNIDPKVLRALSKVPLSHAGAALGKIFKSALGNVSPNDILTTIGGIEIALDKTGAKIDLGKGIAAAQKALTL